MSAMRNRFVPAMTAAGVLVAIGGLTAAEEHARLVQAVRLGDRETLRAVLTLADVNAPEADGTTALHWAVRGDDPNMIELLIRAGADANATNRYGVTPLAVAATNGSATIVDMLLRAGADPKAILPNGETVLMLAARAGNPDVVVTLVEFGADVNAREQTQGQTALMWAAAEGNAAAVRVLAAAGADLDVRSVPLDYPLFKWTLNGMVSTVLPRGGWTALMYAVRQNAHDAAHALIDAGADLDVQDEEGSTALVLAIINTHFDLAAQLIAKGADPNISDETGMAALYAAVDMHTLAPMLARPNLTLKDTLDPTDMVRLLLANGADPNAQLKTPILGRHHGAGDTSLGEGATPLMRAARSSDVMLMRALLDAGADASLTQKDFTNALMLAAAGGRRALAYDIRPFQVSDEVEVEAVTLLLEQGVDPNVFNRNGMTAMHFAAQRGADQIIRVLAARGARLALVNRQGLTPIDLALGRGPRGRGEPVIHERTASLIRMLGADDANTSDGQ